MRIRVVAVGPGGDLPASPAFMISTLRSQVGFAAAVGVAHARLRLDSASQRLSRLELIGGSGRRTAGRATGYASAARAFISPIFRRPPSSRRGEALWDREAAGSGSQGAVSSESAAGSGRLRLRYYSGAAAVESATDSVVALSCGCVQVGLDVCEVRLCDPCGARVPIAVCARER